MTLASISPSPPGLQPRLWIDAVSHVTMGRDRRTYRFLRDTRLGRVVLAESLDIKPVADQVTRYVAERIVERQRMIDGDVEPLPRQAGRPRDERREPRPQAPVALARLPGRPDAWCSPALPSGLILIAAALLWDRLLQLGVGF